MNYHDDALKDALLVARAERTLAEMKATEGFAFTEDSYTARIPGKLLASWCETLDKMLFRLKSTLDK